MDNLYYNQRIECGVRDCDHFENGQCLLSKIFISNDTKNEYSKYNTMCQSYEKKAD